MLLREGVIDEIPSSLCGNPKNKNVILVVGDGMGWEMVRSGAIARKVIDELEGMGCDTKAGCPDNAMAMEAFAGRTLADYYTEGKGSGLSFQELDGFELMTTTSTLTDNLQFQQILTPSLCSHRYSRTKRWKSLCAFELSVGRKRW